MYHHRFVNGEYHQAKTIRVPYIATAHLEKRKQEMVTLVRISVSPIRPQKATINKEDGFIESALKSYLGLKTWESTGLPHIYLTVAMYNLMKAYVEVRKFVLDL